MGSVGRPTKYKEEFAEQAKKLCLLGATDAKLADFFDVNVDTIQEWKKTHAEFSDSIKRGKYYADSEIAQSLYDRAKGCVVTIQQAIKLTTKTPDANGKISQTEEIQIVDLDMEQPPDTTAAIFWLKNRQPAEWRDKHDIDSTVSITQITGMKVV